MVNEVLLKQFLDVDFVNQLVRKTYPNCQVQMIDACSMVVDNDRLIHSISTVFSGKFIYVGYVLASDFKYDGGGGNVRLPCISPMLYCDIDRFAVPLRTLTPVVFDNVDVPVGEMSFSFVGYRVYVEGSITNFIPYNPIIGQHFGSLGNLSLIRAGDLGCVAGISNASGYYMFSSSLGVDLVTSNASVPFYLKLKSPVGASYYNDFKFINFDRSDFPVIDFCKDLMFDDSHFSFVIPDSVTSGSVITLGDKVYNVPVGVNRLVSCTYVEYGNTNVDSSFPMSKFLISLSGTMTVNDVVVSFATLLFDQFTVVKP